MHQLNSQLVYSRKSFIITILLFVFSAITTNAATFGDYTYKVIDGKTVTITDYTESDETEIIIPSTINSLPVTRIGSSAFRDCNSLTSIVIPNSVTWIGHYAFRDCYSLTSIEIPDSVTSIGGYAFYSCNSLTSIVIPNSVTRIGSDAFRDCNSLTSIVIPNSVTSIGDYVFYDCSSLVSVIFEGDIPSIGISIFDYLPTIYYYAEKHGFDDNSDGLADFDTDLVAIKISSSGRFESFGYVIIDASSVRILDYVGVSRVIEIPNTIDSLPVTSIGLRAFYDCSYLTSIELPNSVTMIGYKAFFGCSSLTSIELPNSVTAIGDYAFYDCSSLVSAIIPDSVTTIGNRAFYDCVSLTLIEIPDSVTAIGDYAFYSCSSLTSMVFKGDAPSIERYCLGPSNPTIYYYIGKTGFDDDGDGFADFDTDLTTVVISEFGKFEGYEYVIIDSSSVKIINYTGSNSTIAIPNIIDSLPVTSIWEKAFNYCSSLVAVILPDSVTSIGYMAFGGCSSLTSIEVPNSLTAIGDYAFYRCSSLTSIEVPNSVTSIGYMAFGGCSSLTSIEIPNSLTAIGDYAFYLCSSLTSIEIPDSVTTIGDSAFAYCKSLTSIEIPNSVTTIGNFAFERCSSLTSIEIVDSVIAIEWYAFHDCHSLTSVIFEEDAPSIGRYCFDQSNPTIYYYAEKTGFDDNGDGLADFDKALRAEIIGFSPKMGISVVQIGTELSWMIDDESGVKEYQVIDVKSGEVIAVVTTGDASYSLTLPEGVDVKVVVVADSGYQQSFFPDDSFDDINTTVYDLMEGWNLISITGSNPDLTGLKAEMDGVMWAWNGVEYEVISETYPTQGIWLYSKRDCQVTVTSERVDEQIALQQGWNMVGPVKNCEQLADSLITYKWEPVYERVPTPSILFEGVGYWMFSMEEE